MASAKRAAAETVEETVLPIAPPPAPKADPDALRVYRVHAHGNLRCDQGDVPPGGSVLLTAEQAKALGNVVTIEE